MCFDVLENTGDGSVCYGVMEVSEANNYDSVELSKLLKHFNDINEESILEDIYNSNESLYLSQFPMYIKDTQKYNSLEIYYQKYLDGNLSKEDFLKCENNFNKVLQTHWLYDEVFATIYIDEFDYKHSLYYKMNRSELNKQHEFISRIINNNKSLYNIDDISKLSAVLKIATRDIAPIMLYFKKFNAFLTLNGCSGIIYTQNEKFIELLKLVATTNRLYIFKLEDNTGQEYK